MKRLLGKMAGRGGGRKVRPGARKRLRRQKMKRALRTGLRAALDNYGLNTDGIAKNKGSTAGALLRYSGYKGGDDKDITLPPLSQPERVTGESDPTLSTLNKQFDKLIDVTTKLGVTTKKQQDDLVKQIRASEVKTRESKIEPPAIPEPAEGSGEGIGPGSDAADRLLAAMGILREELEDAVRAEQDRRATAENAFYDYFGLEGVKKDRAAKRARPQLNEGFKQTVDKNGRTIYRDAAGRATTAEKALKNFDTVDPSRLGQSTARARQAERLLTPKASLTSRTLSGVKGLASRVVGGAKTLGTGAVGLAKAAPAAALAGGGSIATKIAEKMKIGRQSAAGVVGATAGKLSPSAVKQTIAKIAKPLVIKNLAKTGLKSIPVVGAIAGGLFAVNRLLKGDVVGAGLEAVSGLGGPLTAIPALVLSLARDVYQGVYGQFPETDPLVGERMGEVKKGVEAVARAALASKVKKKQAATATPRPASTQKLSDSIPGRAPTSDVQQAAERTGAPSVSSIPRASRSPSTGGGSTPTPPEPASSGGGSEPSPSSSSPETSEVPPPPAVQAPITGIQPGAVKPVEPPMTKSGAAIESASGEASAATRVAGDTGSSVPMPSTLPTTRANAKGMGDVPDPSYMGVGDLVKSLYFGAVAGAMV